MENQQKTILVVEDDEILTKTLSGALEEEGFKVIQAFDGEEGLEAVSTKKPDMVLLDIVMPKMDGMTMLKKMHSIEDLRDIPVIILTNLSSADSTSEAVEEGVYTYLVKTDWKISDVIEVIKDSLK